MCMLLHRDPNIVLCGFGWDGADENKMQASITVSTAELHPLTYLARSLSEGLLHHFTAHNLFDTNDKQQQDEVLLKGLWLKCYLGLEMQASFKVGRALFRHYLDLQRVSLALGYHRYGLGSLTERVLGFTLPKPRKVSMSNWEARRLTQDQIVYAALDALITGQIFRALRLWHSSTSACSTCHSLIGSLVECSSLRQVPNGTP